MPCNIRIRAAVAVLSLGFLTHAPARAQSPTDTVRMTLPEAEQALLEKNFLLLAQHYNVDASRALLRQSRILGNPTLSTDQNVYSNGRWFEHSKNPDGSYNGQYYVQLQQVLYTARKRSKLIDLASTNVQVAEVQLADVLRGLRLQLHTDFNTVVRLQGIQQIYQEELAQLTQLLNGLQGQYRAGNIARKDLLRVQALQASLEQDAAENEKAIEDAESDLKTLVAASGGPFIQPVGDLSVPQMPQQNIDALVALAQTNNPAYQAELLGVQGATQNLRLQKALAVPDLTLGPNFDKNSNYTQNYVGLGLSLPIPLFNRNQGNIAAARATVKQQDAEARNSGTDLQNNVEAAYRKLGHTVKLATERRQEFYEDYETLYRNVVASFQQRQISLLEFIDYFEAYKDMRENQLQLQLQLQAAKDELNYQVGTDVVR